MVKILGLVDLMAVGLLLTTAYHLTVPHGLVIGVAVYLLLKGLIFIFDIGSWFDIIAGVLLILSLFIVVPPFVLFGAAALVGLKGIFSLFA